MVKSLAQPGPSNVTAADEPCRVDQDTLHDLDGPRHLQPKVSPDDMAFVGLTLSPRGGKDTGIDQDEAEATVEHEGQKLPLTVQQAVERDAAMEVMGGRGSAGEGVSGAMSSDPSTLTSEQDSRDFLAWMPGGSEALALIEDQVRLSHPHGSNILWGRRAGQEAEAGETLWWRQMS